MMKIIKKVKGKKLHRRHTDITGQSAYEQGNTNSFLKRSTGSAVKARGRRFQKVGATTVKAFGSESRLQDRQKALVSRPRFSACGQEHSNSEIKRVNLCLYFIGD